MQNNGIITFSNSNSSLTPRSWTSSSLRCRTRVSTSERICESSWTPTSSSLRPCSAWPMKVEERMEWGARKPGTSGPGRTEKLTIWQGHTIHYPGKYENSEKNFIPIRIQNQTKRCLLFWKIRLNTLHLFHEEIHCFFIKEFGFSFRFAFIAIYNIHASVLSTWCCS